VFDPVQGTSIVRVFEPVTGKLLGAGIVGFDGVAKMLDVLATALRAGMTVHDPEGLDLASTPPFGSAKDPINLAGFVATGVSVDVDCTGLDCTGLACPGPIMALQAEMAEFAPGDEVLAHVSDPGFRLDAQG
jgi:hypothetical protein